LARNEALKIMIEKLLRNFIRLEHRCEAHHLVEFWVLPTSNREPLEGGNEQG
jgi:hypothetical protein